MGDTDKKTGMDFSDMPIEMEFEPGKRNVLCY